MKKDNKKDKKKVSSSPKQLITLRQLRIYQIALPIIFLAIVGFCLLYFEHDVLFRVQELDLFLFTSYFFKQTMLSISGLLTYVSTFFTQFLYYPIVGVLLLCLLWFALIKAIISTFNMPSKHIAWVLIPVSMLVISVIGMGYWMYYLKIHGWFFASTLGFLTSILLVRGYRLCMDKAYVEVLYIVCCTVIFYPLVGFYALLAVFLMPFLGVRSSNLWRNFIRFGVALLSIIAVPLFFYHYVYHTAHISKIWRMGLPAFNSNGWYIQYYIPYAIIAISFVVFAVLYCKEKKHQNVIKSTRWALTQVLIVAVISVSLWAFWMKDENYHTEISMSKCIDRGDWEKIIDISRKTKKEPTRMIVLCRDLALFKQGRLGEDKYKYKEGAAKAYSPFQVTMLQNTGKPIYFHYGCVNFSYRWCLEDGVEFGWRIDYYKQMVRCAILNGEKKLARKYIDILKTTLFYKKWAEEMLVFIDHSEQITSDSYFSPILHLLSDEDKLESDNSFMELYLIFSLSKITTVDPVYADLILAFAMQSKNIPTFWRAFFQYAKITGGQQMPLHYQEAAMLYGHLEDKVKINNMPFDDRVMESYKELEAFNGKFKGLSDDQRARLYEPQLGKTFYYNYFFVKELVTH